MGRLLNLVTPLHRATQRDYVGRMMDEKVHCMLKAKEYEGDYWDGDRRYGYGGYRFIDGRWAPVAQGRGPLRRSDPKQAQSRRRVRLWRPACARSPPRRSASP